MELNVVSRKYKIGKKLSIGSFGIVRLGRHIKTNECVAVKLEWKKTKEPTLHLEYRFYKILGLNISLPKLFYFGPSGPYNALVMQLLGPTLRDLFELCSGRFLLKTVIQIAIQIITILEYIHSKRIIHRDLKPENFAIGRLADPHLNTLRIFDFGLAKEYIDVYNRHIDWKSGKKIMGTARFISINCHQREEQSRRDDLESAGYILIYFIRGFLPWQPSSSDLSDKYTLIGEQKQSTSIEELCKGLPTEFTRYMQYVRKLRFDETPDYNHIRTMCNDLLHQNHYTNDDVFDWTLVMRSKEDKDKELQRKQKKEHKKKRRKRSKSKHSHKH